MSKQKSAALVLLVAGLIAGAAQAHAQPAQTLRGGEPGTADLTSNTPSGGGEASTMTNGVPNALASNVQPGELGLQTRLTMRQAAPAYGGDPALKLMGGPGPIRPVLIAPPAR